MTVLCCLSFHPWHIIFQDPMLTNTEEKYTPLHYAAYYIPRYQVKPVNQEGRAGSLEMKAHLTSSKEAMQFLVRTTRVEVGL